MHWHEVNVEGRVHGYNSLGLADEMANPSRYIIPMPALSCLKKGGFAGHLLTFTNKQSKRDSQSLNIVLRRSGTSWGPQSNLWKSSSPSTSKPLPSVLCFSLLLLHVCPGKEIIIVLVVDNQDVLNDVLYMFIDHRFAILTHLMDYHNR